jgi:hypothetical protein
MKLLQTAALAFGLYTIPTLAMLGLPETPAARPVLNANLSIVRSLCVPLVSCLPSVDLDRNQQDAEPEPYGSRIYVRGCPVLKDWCLTSCLLGSWYSGDYQIPLKVLSLIIHSL